MWAEAHAVAARSSAAAAAGPQLAASTADAAAPAVRADAACSLDSCRPETVGNGPDSTEDNAISQETVGNCANPLDELAALEAAAALVIDAHDTHLSSSTPPSGRCEDEHPCRAAAEVATEEFCINDEESGDFGFDMGPAAYF